MVGSDVSKWLLKLRWCFVVPLSWSDGYKLLHVVISYWLCYNYWHDSSIECVFFLIFIKINQCIFVNCGTEKENLCLYGSPNEKWEVNLPAEEVPPELPEPALGINFARDGMQEKDWLSLVAVHSDAWLLAVAFYFGSRFGFDKSDRYVFPFPPVFYSAE